MDILEVFKSDFKTMSVSSLKKKWKINHYTGSVSLNIKPKVQYRGIEDNNSFITYCSLFGLEQKHYNIEIELEDGTYCKIVGITPKSHKYPIVVQANDGIKYKITEFDVQKYLKKTNQLN